jgi:hypothetical protein
LNLLWNGFQKIVIRHAALWLALGIVVICAAVLYPYAPRRVDTVPSHDSGIFLYFGQQILNGKIPYRDLWDHKPPLVFYIDALGLWLGKGSIWGVWWLEVLSLSSASLLAFFTLRRFYGTLGALPAAALPFAAVLVFEGGNLTEEFALPFQFLALFLLLRPHEDEVPRARAILAGAAFGAAFLLKQNLIGVWVALGVWMVLRGLQRTCSLRLQRTGSPSARRMGPTAGRMGSTLLAFAWMLSGAVGVLAVTAIYFGLYHSLGALWDVAFRFNFLYSDVEGGQRIEALKDMAQFLSGTSGFLTAGLVAWVVAGGVLAWKHTVLFSKTNLIYAQDSWGLPVLFVAWLDLPIELALIGTSARGYHHYYLSLLPAVTFLVAFLFAGLYRLAACLPRRSLRLSSAILLSTLLWLGLVLAGLPALIRQWRAPRDVSINLAVTYIRKNTAAQDPVLMWGSQSVVNFLTGRSAPTRFVHTKPLFRDGYSTPALADELLTDLEANPPRLIVDTRLASTPFVEGGPEGACRAPQGNYPQWVGEVYAYICDHYTWVQTLGKDEWQVWKLIDSKP